MSMSDKSEGCFAALIAILVVLPLSAVLYAWAAMLNWNWFATTVGAPRIGFLQAYGLSLVVSSFISESSSKANEKESLAYRVVYAFLMTILRFAVLVGAGAALHAAMTS